MKKINFLLPQQRRRRFDRSHLNNLALIKSLLFRPTPSDGNFSVSTFLSLPGNVRKYSNKDDGNSIG